MVTYSSFITNGHKLTTYDEYNYKLWEEAFQIQNEEEFNKLDLSIRGKVPDGYFKQITFTFNP